MLEEITAPLVGSRLCKDLDAAESKFVVLRGKWILVDANFADRVFGRQFASAETINIDRPSTRPGGRAGQRSQVVSQFVGVVCQCIQVCTAHHQGTGIVFRSQCDARCFFLDFDALSSRDDL